VDRYTRSGSAENVAIAMTNGSESLMAVVDGKIIDIRVPIRRASSTKLADWAIDDRSRLEGQGPVHHVGTRTVFHKKAGPRQPEGLQGAIRPNPLAN